MNDLVRVVIGVIPVVVEAEMYSCGILTRLDKGFKWSVLSTI